MKTTKTYLKGCDWCNATGQKFPMEHNGTSFSSLCPVCNGAKTILVTEVTEPVAPQENIREDEMRAMIKDFFEFHNPANIGYSGIDKLIDEYLANRPEATISAKPSDEDIDEWSKTLDYSESWKGLSTVRKGVMFGAKSMRDNLITPK